MSGSQRPAPVRLAVLTGSPVPYKIPTYRALAAHPAIDFTAIFASTGGVRPYDDGFGQEITWDLDITAGYRNVFLRRADRSPIVGTFWSVRDPDVVNVVRRGRFEVLWLEGYNSATYMMGAATQRASGGRLIFREEQTMLHPRSLAKTLVKEVALRALFRGTRAMYVSRENRRWLEHYGVPTQRLFSAPYTVDNAFFGSEADRLRPSKVELRRTFGIADDGGPVVLTVSRLVPKKQPLFLLEAFRRMRMERPCSLLIAGSGPLEEEMREKVLSDGIPDVHFAGFLNQGQVSCAYACADVFALLSREHETFGVVVAEAMNFALPVVVSDKVGCAADLVTPGVNGDVVLADDPQAAADSLARLVDDAALRDAAGRASRERIDEWTPCRTAEGVLAATAAAVGRERWERARRGT